MRRRLLIALLSAANVIAMCVGTGGFAAPLPNAALSFSQLRMSAVTKVQYACGWTYSCTGIGNGGTGSTQVQVYGPVNVYANTGVDVKQDDIWRVPEGAWPWTGDQGSQTWRGWGCGGYPCDEKCGASCWFNRIRNGYCGHGCNVYREHVMFQSMGGTLRPFIYRNSGDWGGGGYGAVGYGGGGAAYGDGGVAYGGGGVAYGSGDGGTSIDYGQSGQSTADYGQTQDGYNSSTGNGSGQAPADYSQSAQSEQGGYGSQEPRERFIDRLRRYFYGRPRAQDYRDTASIRDRGPVRFERPIRGEGVPMRPFKGPKYPPDGTGAVTK